MLLAEGKERFRNEALRTSSMRAMADSGAAAAAACLGVGFLHINMNVGLILQQNRGEGSSYENNNSNNSNNNTRQCPPVQLDLLPLPALRPCDSSSGATTTTTRALPTPSSINKNTGFSISWQQPHRNGYHKTSNSGSGYDNGEMVERYGTGGGHGASSSSPRGIDINQLPSTTEFDAEETDVLSSPSSISISMKKRDREEEKFHEFDLERETTTTTTARACCQDPSSRACSDDDDEDGGGGTARKKLRLSKQQSALLEESFKEHITLSPKQKSALAKQLNLRPRQVEVWFQNRRARTKLKQTEVDCELLKRCCETLTEENTRLQKKLQELRAIKVAAPYVMAATRDFYMPLPTATLTMCPSCERVATVDNRSITFAKPRYAHSSQSPTAC